MVNEDMCVICSDGRTRETERQRGVISKRSEEKINLFDGMSRTIDLRLTQSLPSARSAVRSLQTNPTFFSDAAALTNDAIEMPFSSIEA